MSDDDPIRRGDALALTRDPFGGETVTSQAIAALPAATPATSPGVTAGAAEPVAWLYGEVGKRGLIIGHVHGRDYSKLPNATPLYATPHTALDDPKVRKLMEALGKKTTHGERKEFSRVGHSLTEASWHVHLAGFRSQAEADDFLRAALRDMEGA